MSKSIIYLSIIYYLSQFLMQKAAHDIHRSLLFTLNNRCWRSVHSSIWRFTSFLFSATSFVQPIFMSLAVFSLFTTVNYLQWIGLYCCQWTFAIILEILRQRINEYVFLVLGAKLSIADMPFCIPTSLLGKCLFPAITC